MEPVQGSAPGPGNPLGPARAGGAGGANRALRPGCSDGTSRSRGAGQTNGTRRTRGPRRTRRAFRSSQSGDQVRIPKHQSVRGHQPRERRRRRGGALEVIAIQRRAAKRRRHRDGGDPGRIQHASGQHDDIGADCQSHSGITEPGVGGAANQGKVGERRANQLDDHALARGNRRRRRLKDGRLRRREAAEGEKQEQTRGRDADERHGSPRTSCGGDAAQRADAHNQYASNTAWLLHAKIMRWPSAV